MEMVGICVALALLILFAITVVGAIAATILDAYIELDWGKLFYWALLVASLGACIGYVLQHFGFYF